MINPLQAETIFNHLYGNINGYSVSNQARESSGMNTEKLLYGELPFETCQKILEYVKPKSDGVFFDLGSLATRSRRWMASPCLTDKPCGS